MSKGTYSFSTPIYYVNAAPHLGTAYTTIAADTVARYQRLNGYDVKFVTGMDEHGQKVADTATAKGMTPQAWTDSMEPVFRDTWDMLNISYTDFVRTTEPRHARTVRTFWNDLYEKGYLYKGCYEGWYCVHEETYYAESDLEKNDEGEFVCPDCHRPVQRAAGEENWFFKLSDFQDKLLAFYDEHPDFIRPVTRRNEIVSFVSRGLKDLSISRSTFDWGVPFSFDKGHVAYVWADALLAYLTGLGYADPDRPGEFEQSWPMQYHFVGKDIIRFHCVIWPAMLMAAGLPITQCVFGHGFLLTKGEKMSKSRGNAIMPADLVKVFGVDAYRYYFMSDIQFGHDGSISIERMVQVYNADLANTWGNLCSRVFNMTGKYFDGRVPQAPASAADNPLHEIARDLYASYDHCMTDVDFTGAVNAVRALAGRANAYIEESAPWNLAKDPALHDELCAVIYNALEACRIIALFTEPLMPTTSAEVFRRLGLDDIAKVTDIEHASEWGGLPAGNTVIKGDPLFPRLNADDIDLSLE
jgi:methionyl-tRNA synthetase